MAKVNFKKVAVKGIDGKVENVDFSKEIGNAIFKTTKDIGSVMLTDTISKVVVKNYWVIQNGVQTSYDWKCSLDTFHWVNGIEPPILVPGPGGDLIH